MKRLNESSGSGRREGADGGAKSKPPPHVGGYEI